MPIMLHLHVLESNMTELAINASITVLFSYDTPVAALISGRGILRTNKFWSTTTSRHIKKWIGVTGKPVTEVEQEEIDKLLVLQDRSLE